MDVFPRFSNLLTVSPKGVTEQTALDEPCTVSLIGVSERYLGVMVHPTPEASCGVPASHVLGSAHSFLGRKTESFSQSLHSHKFLLMDKSSFHLPLRLFSKIFVESFTAINSDACLHPSFISITHSFLALSGKL